MATGASRPSFFSSESRQLGRPLVDRSQEETKGEKKLGLYRASSSSDMRGCSKDYPLVPSDSLSSFARYKYRLFFFSLGVGVGINTNIVAVYL